jgi:hypothetical protein
MGINDPSVRHFEALGLTPTIFQAEMYAIDVYARICLEHESNDNKFIMSDSQAALRAVREERMLSNLNYTERKKRWKNRYSLAIFSTKRSQFSTRYFHCKISPQEIAIFSLFNRK